MVIFMRPHTWFTHGLYDQLPLPPSSWGRLAIQKTALKPVPLNIHGWTLLDFSKW